jgi:hypothetical protein
MKRLSCILTFVLLATPVFAQDGGGDFGGGGDGGFFGGDGGGLFGGGGNAGGGGGRNAEAPDRLVTLKDMLTKANAPLSRDQERALNTLLDKEIKAMSEAFQTKFGQDPAAVVGAQRGAARGGQQQGRGQNPSQNAGQNPPQARGQGGFEAGQRGARAGAGAGAGAENPMVAEIRRMNEELLGKVTASLNPQQQAVIKKYQNDQIRARGGLDALKLVIEEAGAPALNPDQVTQIQALYAEQNQARIQMLREAQGQPDPAKVRDLELQTMTKVTRILTPDQRKALLESMAKPRQ